MNARERVKQIRHDSDPNAPPYLEAHHYITQNHEGGRSDLTNLFAVSVVEHAACHYLLARKSRNKEESRANFWAVSKIVQRMSPEELKEFNKRINR